MRVRLLEYYDTRDTETRIVVLKGTKGRTDRPSEFGAWSNPRALIVVTWDAVFAYSHPAEGLTHKLITGWEDDVPADLLEAIDEEED